MACFVFGGVDYADILDVASIEMPAIPESAPDLRYASGRDGALLASNDLKPLYIRVKVRLATEHIDPRDIQRRWAEVAATMRHAEPEMLSLADGIWYLAVLADDSRLEFNTYSAFATLTFLCPDPVAYGDERTVEVPSGGSVDFLVGGSYPARPVINAAAVRDSVSNIWGVRLDSGDFIHVATGSASVRNVEADCAARTCIVNGNPALPTLDSDWLVLEPGPHTLEMDNGTGAATVTFRERWL